MIGALKRAARAIYYLRRPEALPAIAALASAHALREAVMADHPGLVLEASVHLIGYAPERLLGGSARVATGSILSFGDETGGFGSIEIGEGSWIGQYNNLRTSARRTHQDRIQVSDLPVLHAHRSQSRSRTELPDHGSAP